MDLNKDKYLNIKVQNIFIYSIVIAFFNEWNKLKIIGTFNIRISRISKYNQRLTTIN